MSFRKTGSKPPASKNPVVTPPIPAKISAIRIYPQRLAGRQLLYIYCTYYTECCQWCNLVVQSSNAVIKRGRPRGRNRAQTREARSFFNTVDQLGLSYDDVINAIGAQNREVPSYRTLQDWRRGVN